MSSHPHSTAGIVSLKNHSGNAELECQRRKDRGMGVGRGSAPRQKNFSILDLKWANFGVNSAFCTVRHSQAFPLETIPAPQ